MKTINLALTIILTLITSSVSWAQVTERQILKWMDKSEGRIVLSNITKIKQENGDAAYLASAEFPDQGRNFWAGYVYAWPAQRKAIVLKGYGGQYNKISILSQTNNTSIILIGSAGSGQGQQDEIKYIVSFNGWNINKWHSTQTANNFGNCGKELNDELCEGNETFINPTQSINDHALSIVETTVNYRGEFRNNLQATTSSRILSFPLNKKQR